MNMHYILDENKNPIPEPDYMKWARWYEANDDKRHVGNDFIPYRDGQIHVSTVFLSLEHVDNNIRDRDRIKFDMLYETMIFGPDEVIEQLVKMSESETRSIFAQMTGDFDIQKRYRTREEAEHGHKTMVQFVTVCLVRIKEASA